MDKATALQLISQAWDSINQLTAAYRADELPADLYDHCEPGQAHANVWGTLAPLIHAEINDIEYCAFNQLVEELATKLGCPDPDEGDDDEG
ncbi:hypothetical protein S2L_08 [Cyanophage S-2L]|nr:hypothetical protein S2L_08 [Cyanophage S-2L]